MTTVETATEIRPFHVDIPDEELAELRRRIGATRSPTKELVADRSQGVQLATMQALARYWTTDYDWRRAEAKLNALPQFTTEIDGVEIHFIHVKSAHKNALPLIMTHGWPGSVVELLEAVGPLTDPTAHGGNADDAFHLVLPSLPGYGFSSEPTELGWGAGRVAQAWPELMRRLGYTRYVAQGGDVGAAVTDAMGRQAPEGLIGIHTNLFVPALGGVMPTDTDEERAAADQIATFRATGFGYFVEQATRPQTIGYALLDSPVALAAWMLDHDTDSYYKISSAFVDGKPAGNLTRDHILDNITLYWLTGTGASAARSYWESGQATATGGRPDPAAYDAPVGFTTFPGEIWRRRAAGSRRTTPTSSTSTRSTRAATSRPGRSRSSSRPRCGLHSSHCDETHHMSTLDTAYQPTVARDQARALFGQTMGLVAITAGFFAVGAYLARDLSYGWGFVAYIASFALLIGLNYAVSRSEQLAIGMLFGFGALVGVGTAPTIAYYASTNPQSVWQAGAATALFIAGFGAAGYATRRDLSGLARLCFWALLALIVFGIVAIFVRIPNSALIYSIVGLVIFAGFTMYDFQRLRRTQDIRAAPLLAASIFLDVLNVFLLLLSLFNRD